MLSLPQETAVRGAAPSVRKVEHVTIQYTIKFDFTFDVEHPVTQREYTELAQQALADMRAQLPPHVEAYPELILKELAKRKLLDLETFRRRGNGARR